MFNRSDSESRSEWGQKAGERQPVMWEKNVSSSSYIIINDDLSVETAPHLTPSIPFCSCVPMSKAQVLDVVTIDLYLIVLILSLIVIN